MSSSAQDATVQPSPPTLEPEIERELLRAYIDSANDGIFVVCDEMKFHVANPVLAEWIGVSEADLTAHGKRLPMTECLGLVEAESQFRRHFRSVLDGQTTRIEIQIAPPRGQARWVEVSMSRVQLEAGELIIGIMRDITERKMLETALQHLASHDDLTGLINRRQFQTRLKELVESAQAGQGPHALVYIDLDQFKVINDTCGHQAGDELLRQLGTRLKQLAETGDTTARLGGDEFGILLNARSIDAAREAATAICDSIAGHRFVWGNRSFEITASIGVCAIDHTTLTAEDALNEADAACYVAKDQGRNRVQLYFGGTACLGKRQEMQWVSRLQQALDENRFQVWHQHIHDLKQAPNVRKGHFEALLRLIDEQGNIIPPAQFFPAAERYGLMPSIDRWVVQHLLLDGGGNRLLNALSHSSSTHCAINLSGASLNDDRFLEFLEDALRRTRLDGTSLCFEITETIAVNNFERVREVMQAIKQFGCRFALDDFGSGMSSFSYLKNLPVDYLKIDGSLVRNIGQDATDFAMVEAINRIGNALGLKTVAEFVETDMTLHKLKAIGIDYAQGYAVHRPEALIQSARKG